LAQGFRGFSLWLLDLMCLGRHHISGSVVKGVHLMVDRKQRREYRKGPGPDIATKDTLRDLLLQLGPTEPPKIMPPARDQAFNM
jgi:hypothetical protein